MVKEILHAIFKGGRNIKPLKNKKGWLFLTAMGGCCLSYGFASLFKELGSIAGVTICSVFCAAAFLFAILILLSSPQKYPTGSGPEEVNKSEEVVNPIAVAPVKKMKKRKKNNKDSKLELEQIETNSMHVSFLITENNSNCKMITNIVNNPTLSESLDNSDQTKDGIIFYEEKVIYLLTLKEESEFLQGGDILKIDVLRNISLN